MAPIFLCLSQATCFLCRRESARDREARGPDQGSSRTQIASSPTPGTERERGRYMTHPHAAHRSTIISPSHTHTTTSHPHTRTTTHTLTPHPHTLTTTTHSHLFFPPLLVLSLSRCKLLLHLLQYNLVLLQITTHLLHAHSQNKEVIWMRLTHTQCHTRCAV